MFGRNKEKSEEQKNIEKYENADQYKIICGTAHEVEDQMNELHEGFPQYVAHLFAKNEDETNLCVIMQKRWTGGHL